MQRGELYRVRRPGGTDPRRSRVFAIVSRQLLVDSSYSTVICAPVFSAYDALSTQLPVGFEAGMKHPSSLHCDQLMSIPKSALTDYVGRLSANQLAALEQALRVALDLAGSDRGA